MDNQLSGTVAELEARDIAIATLQTELDKIRGEVEERGSAIVTLQNELELVRSEILDKDVAIAKLKAELEAREDKQLNLLPPELTPTPTQTPEQKTKTKSKANPVPEIDLASLIIPPGYKLGDSAELIEFVLEKFPNSELKNKGDITDAIRDRHGKAKGSENSRLFNFEQECGFKHLGKVGAKHKFLIPIG